MPHSNPSDQELKELLTNATTIAIVGASSNPDKASYGIMQKLQKAGYKVIPVNPRETEILGERSYPSLIDVPERIDIVDVFRRSEHVGAIVDESLAVHPKLIWLQLGVVDAAAAQRAAAAGIALIQDLCIAIEHKSLAV